MSHEKVLIVEDNKLNLRLMDFILKSRGYQVLSAADADECLGLCKSQKPDLILMDLQLPGVDGLSLTRHLRELPETSGAIIIAVTAKAMKMDRERALEAGCDAYLAKPIDTRKLPETIEELLDRKKARN